MTTEQPWTIGRLLDWTTKFLGQKGSESPRLDAQVLLAHALGCKRIELYTRHDEPASDEARGQAKRRLWRPLREPVPAHARWRLGAQHKAGWQPQPGGRPAQGSGGSGSPGAAQASSSGRPAAGARPSTGSAPAGLGPDARARRGMRGDAQ